ncbi:hypothetical protein BT96DRAFT_1008925 [Gymnopus androsaceus JB14]|uniref:Uncharacterized protein n=1 Tax=Gymnopus androsaceus JB14 TaxID=1447944 RepID=A0A6A4GDM3_9AGAR|nr:hypothetical protein BT96DRAFT_1008925 [Gymnopus androsaceus JB14]
MSSPQPPRRSLRLKRKLEIESPSKASKHMKRPDRPKASEHLPSKRTAPKSNDSQSRRIPSSRLISPSNSGPSNESGASNAGLCRCTSHDRQEALIEACNRLAILCEQEDLDWSLLFAMQGLYRPLKRRVEAWEVEPTPSSIVGGQVVFEGDRDGRSD